MQSVIEDIKKLFQSFSKAVISSIDKIPQSGSDRMYFRVIADRESYIATYNTNIKENETFLYFSKHFKKCGCPVPEVFAINNEHSIYIQEDLGDSSLLNELEKNGHNVYVYDLFKKTLRSLAQLQIKGDEGLDYDQTITSKEFGKQAIVSDLLYFKYYFLDTLKIPYDKEKLIDDFDAFSTYLSHVDHKYFMFRDFQSRNIMVKDNSVHFIDYQGGMKGALQYDVASLLWQAKAELSDEWKNTLLQYYMVCVEDILEKPIDKNQFESQYNGYVLIRLLQVLGAYGFRGLFERKAHFLTSIPLALKNIQWFIANKQVGLSLPEFERLLNLMTADEVINRFEAIKATASTPLVVKINSFSYKITGYPKDETDNGGGFVFDCRSILNPGRIEEFKKQTGRDKPVKDYLEQQTEMPEFLNSVYNIVDIAVENYIERNFASLMINFGCTGGRHRSVYAADAVARHLRNKYNVKIELNHLEQNIHEVKN
ncbi:MAG TPA: RNase adapter RapZ [Ferruginibacter sp.]|jgi:aminoglycoside/choline kinase family phosphotransferase|nr:RNase adapter RapZ [Ferruginibacter sp.]